MSGWIQYYAWPEAAIMIPWDIWLITWIAAAFWSSRIVKRPGIGPELPYRILTLSGFVLVLEIRSQDSGDYLRGLAGANLLTARHWALSYETGWVMVGLVFLGMLFAWWARIHMGGLWSARITRKEGHRIIDTGPYAIVRHPIYTGLILAIFATTAEKGSALAVLGAMVFVAGYWMKARREEHFLRGELGAAAYDGYAARTRMLIPFVI